MGCGLPSKFGRGRVSFGGRWSCAGGRGGCTVTHAEPEAEDGVRASAAGTKGKVLAAEASYGWKHPTRARAAAPVKQRRSPVRRSASARSLAFGGGRFPSMESGARNIDRRTGRQVEVSLGRAVLRRLREDLLDISAPLRVRRAATRSLPMTGRGRGSACSARQHVGRWVPHDGGEFVSARWAATALGAPHAAGCSISRLSLGAVGRGR